MNKKLIIKFPKLLRQALENKIVELPSDIKDEYPAVEAYRALSIVKGEPPQITHEAFASQMELKHLYPNNRNLKDCDENDISNYSCSLYFDVNKLNKYMRLPRQSKAVIKGLVRCENGVMNYNSETTHINWWLYTDHTAVEDFKVI